jgi:hypothetical protein
MALRDVLGVFKDVDSAVAGVDKLAEVGIERDDYEVLSNAPFPEGTFGHSHQTTRLGLWPLVGASCGFAVGLLLTGGTQIAYPMVTDGKPLFSIPPMLIIMYEGTMLAAVIFTFLGALFESRLPRFHRPVYDPLITDGYIGVLVHIDEDRMDQAAAALREAGAERVHLETVQSRAAQGNQRQGKGANA